jgi:glyoxylase-like metal-dependent hydrolase (beta-lactamase superfamily II)
MKVHAIQTGTVAVKSRQPHGVGRGVRRQLNTLLDRSWTEPLPIYAFAIEHPEGVIVLDTGETARACEPGYFPRWHPYFRLGVREWVTPEQEIGPQLRALGIEPREVRKVVLTHMHTDHAGGLDHFPGVEVLVSRRELKLAAGLAGRVRGYVNNRLPEHFHPIPLDLGAAPFGAFPESVSLTAAGDVHAVALPGHTAGHIGVVLMEDDRAVLFAGDSSYSQELLLAGVVDGVAPDERVARETGRRIREFARETPTVYLPAHDPDSARRLRGRETIARDRGEER